MKPRGALRAARGGGRQAPSSGGRIAGWRRECRSWSVALWIITLWSCSLRSVTARVPTRAWRASRGGGLPAPERVQFISLNLFLARENFEAAAWPSVTSGYHSQVDFIRVSPPGKCLSRGPLPSIYHTQCTYTGGGLPFVAALRASITAMRRCTHTNTHITLYAYICVYGVGYVHYCSSRVGYLRSYTRTGMGLPFATAWRANTSAMRRPSLPSPTTAIASPGDIRPCRGGGVRVWQ